MEMTEHMTNEELRLTIAELKGWRMVIHFYNNETLIGVSPHTGLSEIIPNWPENLDAASELMTIDCSLTRVNENIWPDKWECSSEHPTERNEYPASIARYADIPEIAICKWYLAYEAVLAIPNGN